MPIRTTSPAISVSVVALAAVLGLASTAVMADPADDQYAVAAGHYAEQHWDLAAEQFEIFLREYPQHPKNHRAIFFLAEALLQLGKADDAAGRFDQYLTAAPQGQFARPGLFRAAEAEYLSKRPQRAQPELQRFLAKYPHDKLNAYTLVYLGNIALNQSKWSQAEGYFRRALHDFPHGALQDDCRFGLARVLEKLGNTEEAERFYLAVAAKWGNSLADDAQFHLGALQYAGGRFDEAIRTFAPFASRLKESDWRATARLGHGWALLKMERLPEAAAVFESIRSDAGLGIEARYWLGLTQKSQRDWQTAATTLLEAAEDAPHHTLAAAMRFHAGDAMIRGGDFEVADVQFRQVVASAPDDNEWLDDAARGRVQVAFRVNDSSRLEASVETFLARFPQSDLRNDVLRMAARSRLERKQYQAALDAVRAIEADQEPNARKDDDLLLRALCLDGLGRRRESLDVLQPVLQSAQGRALADAQLTQASLLLALGQCLEAVAPLEALLASAPSGESEIKGKGQLAICYARIGRLDEAKQLYTTLRAEHPHHLLVAETTEQLAEAAYDADDPAWSEQLFETIRRSGRSDQSEFKGLLGIGWSRYQAGRLAEAEEVLGQLLAKDPPATFAAEAALLRGNVLQQLGRDKDALAMYELIVNRYTSSVQRADALMAAASLHDRRDEYQMAAARYAQLAADYPQSSEIDKVIYNWAWMLLQSGKTDQAQTLFKRIHHDYRDGPYWAHATLPLARRAYATGDFRRAEDLVGELIQRSTHPAIRDRALYLAGQIAQAKGDWQQSSRRFGQLLTECPLSDLRRLAEYGIAEAAFRRNDYQSAAERFGELAQATDGGNPGDDDPLLWAAIQLRIAQLLCRQERWNEALATASEIVVKYPHFEQRYEVDYVVGRCLSARADFQGARQAYQQVIRSEASEKTETAAKAQLMIAESFYYQKNYEDALRAYLRLEILYDFPSLQAAAVFQAAKCREMLGEWQDAEELYDKLIHSYPDTLWAEKSLARREATRRRGTPTTTLPASLQTDGRNDR